MVAKHSESPPTPSYTVQMPGGVRPFALRRIDMLRLLPSPRLVQRLLATSHLPKGENWLTLARPGRPGCELLVTTESFERACRRLEAGEQPPLLPCETRSKGRKVR